MNIQRYVMNSVVGGLMGTLIIHILLIGLFLIKVDVVSLPANHTDGTTSVYAESAPDAMLVLMPMSESQGLEDKAIVDRQLWRLSPPGPNPLDTIAVPPPAPVQIDTPEIPIQDAVSSVSGSDSNGDARLLWIYGRQLQSRIESKWRRPRTPIEQSSPSKTNHAGRNMFSCEIQIARAANGDVQDIRFPHCNGSEAWQLSLLTAIQQAIPLPAPPGLMTANYTTTLRFVGFEYREGGNSLEYEPADSSN